MSRATTVIIPCYNAEMYLPEALESVRDQTRPVREIIIVDDGSTPPVSVPRWDDPPIHLIRTPNQGQTAARNLALNWASGEFVALLDADDTWMPSKIEAQEEALQSDPTAVACYTQCVQGPGLFGFGPYPPADVSDDEFLLVLWYDAFFPPSSLMFRRNVIAQVGAFDEELRVGEDVEFFFRLLKAGHIVQVSQPLCRYRVHPGQFTSSLNKKLAASKLARAKMISLHADRLVQAGLPQDKLWNSYRNEILLAFYRRQFDAARPLLWDYWRDHPTDWAVLFRAMVALLPSGLVQRLRDRRGSISGRACNENSLANYTAPVERSWEQAREQIAALIGQ